MTLRVLLRTAFDADESKASTTERRATEVPSDT